MNVTGYHVWNIAAHVLCGIVLIGLVRRTLGLPGLPAALGQRATNLAFAAALVWTLHPLNTEVVDYVTQRSESMMALFFLLTLYASVRDWPLAVCGRGGVRPGDGMQGVDGHCPDHRGVV